MVITHYLSINSEGFSKALCGVWTDKTTNNSGLITCNSCNQFRSLNITERLNDYYVIFSCYICNKSSKRLLSKLKLNATCSNNCRGKKRTKAFGGIKECTRCHKKKNEETDFSDRTVKGKTYKSSVCKSCRREYEQHTKDIKNKKEEMHGQKIKCHGCKRLCDALDLSKDSTLCVVCYDEKHNESNKFDEFWRSHQYVV